MACVGREQRHGAIQDRWLSAKYPPTEICGPQIEPETLVSAWLTASENNLCRLMLSYASPDRLEIVPDYRGAVEYFDIRAVSINEADKGNNEGPNLKEVSIQGQLDFTLEGENHTRTIWSILLEERAGMWFRVDGYH